MESVKLDVEVKHVTAKAVLVVLLDGDGVEKWIPISCLDLDDTDVPFEKGETGTIAVKGWFAQKEGLGG